jgi:hypothetical protein
VNVEESRKLVGVLYELLAQRKLKQQDHITLNLVPMIYAPGDKRRLSRWNMGPGSSALPPLTISRTDNDSYTSMPNPIKDNVYYAPKASNQVAVDSFIKVGNLLIVFQFTISSIHDIEKGISTLFPEDSRPSELQWYLVFVVPPEVSELSCPLQSDMTLDLEPVNFYSMVVDPE